MAQLGHCQHSQTGKTKGIVKILDYSLRRTTEKTVFQNLNSLGS